MSTKTKTKTLDCPSYSFASTAEFESFLEREHATLPSFYLKVARKASGIPSVNREEATVIALCFGWIDGIGNGIDDNWYQVRFTPRRSKSIWSQKNVDTVGRLMSEGRMRPAGIAMVEAAKADGRWDRAYAGPATIQVPDDFAAELTTEPTAKAFFEGFNRSDRYSVLWRVETASVNTRAKRVKELVRMLANGERPKPPVKKPAAKNAAQNGSDVSRSKSTSRVMKPRKAITKVSKAIVNDETTSKLHDVEVKQPRRAGLRARA